MTDKDRGSERLGTGFSEGDDRAVCAVELILLHEAWSLEEIPCQ